MQPLISPVDHESRHNSHRAEEIHNTGATEDTPLLHRFPPVPPSERNAVTTAVVTLLLVILLSGIVIGIYLLILQSRSENVLPPVEEMPLQFVSRMQWDRGAAAAPALGKAPHRAREVIVVQTDTEQCHSTVVCSELLRRMQKETNGTSLPYNFLVSSNGQTYEALGWRRQSPVFPQHAGSALVLAFIGNFTSVSPPRAQIVEANKFFAESVSRQYLHPSYTVIGKNSQYHPAGLFVSMKQVPQWNAELTDTPNT